MSIFIIALVGLWVLAAVVLSGQIVRVWRLDFATVGAMTVSQVCRTSRRGAVITFMALVTLSWPLWLEISFWDRAVFRDGKLVRVIDSGAVMLQGTWNKTTAGADVFTLMGAEASLTTVEITASNAILLIAINGNNDRDSTLRRMEYCLGSGMRVDMIGYPPSIVKKVVGESPQFDELCRTAKMLSIEENSDGTSRLKTKRKVLEIAEKMSEDLWSRFGIRIVDVDIR